MSLRISLSSRSCSRSRGAAVFLLGFALLASGCDKLKSVGGKGDDGGTTSSGGGGGLLSFLGSDFEGEITLNVSAKGKGADGIPKSLLFGIKKPKYRIDTTGNVANNPLLGQGASILLDPPQKRGYLLMPAKKQAILLDFEKLKSMKMPSLPGSSGGAAGKPGAPSTPPTVEKTGKKDSVAGYECEIWKVTQADGRKAEICAAEGIKWIDLGDLGWSSPELTVAAVTSEANRFPLRIVSYDPKGVEEMRVEASKIDKKKLDDAHFNVPADYQVADISALLGGLQGMPGMPALPTAPTGKVR